MPLRCINSAKYNMTADVLRQGGGGSYPDPDDEDYGHWEEQQDPLTHEIVRVWVPAIVTPDDPSTPDIDESTYMSVKCQVRGIVDGGIRVAGTTERWGELYENVDYTKMHFPTNKIITKRDRITNVRNRKGQIIWRDEETNPLATSGWRSTVFDVLGVTPLVDPFGNHIENIALLEKAQLYSGTQ